VCAHGTTGINTFGVYIRYRDAEKSTHTFHTVEERDTFIEKFAAAWKEALSQLYE
jgi:hypothetical protein